MRKLFYLTSVLLIILSGFICSSCNKEESTNKVFSSNMPHFVMSVNYDSITDIYSGYDVDFQLKKHHFMNNRLIDSTDIYLDVHAFDSATFVFNSDTTITVVKDKDTLTISQINYNGLLGHNEFSFIITGASARPASFIISSDLYDFSTYMSSFNTKALPVGYLLYGAALLIAAGIDYYCDTKIANGVNGCTAQGKCSKVGVCCVECVTCEKPRP